MKHEIFFVATALLFAFWATALINPQYQLALWIAEQISLAVR